METSASHAQGLGDESSIWFKLTPLLRGDPENPMRILMHMAERYGPVIPVNLANQRIVLISEPELFKYVLVTKVDNYVKYFDGLRPVFGKSMITHDGALWQKIRMPQQPAFHPDMFAEYIPYFLTAIRQKMDTWAELARTGDTVEMVEQTWTLAADMICKALFDRDMPFNPHFIFKCVKTYTDVPSHKDLRMKKVANADFEVGEADVIRQAKRVVFKARRRRNRAVHRGNLQAPCSYMETAAGHKRRRARRDTSREAVSTSMKTR